MEKFEDVFVQYKPMMHQIIRKLNIYKNFEHFEQIAAIALWRAWQKYESSKGSFTSYAYLSIRGALLDTLKKEAKVATNEQCADDAFLTVFPTIEDSFHEELEALMACLKKEERQLIIAHYIDGYKYAELAVHFNVSEAAIKKRTQRILQKLRLYAQNLL